MLYRVFYPQITQTVYRICVICGLVFPSCLIADGQKLDSFEGFMTGIRANAVSGEVINQGKDARFPRNTITVRDGKVIFNQRSVGSCKVIAGATISDCDRKLKDNFDYWSQYRDEGEMYNGHATVARVIELTRLLQNT